MRKLIRHRWIEQPGFRVHKCEYCGVIKYWDSGYQRIMFKRFINGIARVGYFAPACKRIFHCDKINLNDIGTDWNDGEFYK